MIDDRRNLVWVLAATIVPLLLFIQKPVHIDDSAFLEVAQNILQHPFDPFHGSIALVDNDYHVFRMNGLEPNTFESMSHPPLISYVMAAVIKLLGKPSEIPLHIAFMIFPIFAATAAFSLAERFTKIPRVAALFLVVSPIFVVNAQNLMTDLPMLALMLSSIAFFLNGVDRQKLSFVVLAGLFAGLALLTRYIAFLIFPIFFSYALLKQKGSKPALIASLCAFAVFAVWLIENFAIYGTAHVTASYSFYKFFYEEHQKTNLVKAACDISALGGLSFFLALLIGYLQKARLKLTVPASLTAALILLLILKQGTTYLADYTALKLLTLYIFLSVGFFLIAEVIRVFVQNIELKEDLSVRSEDVLFLFIWFCLSFLAGIFLLPFGTARYVLPSLLPLILILFSGLDSSILKKGRILNFCIIGTFILSLVISLADFEYAFTYKTFARNVREMYRNERLWFIGEWGFRYYMKEQGANYLLSTDHSPAIGDIIIKPQIAGLHEMNPSLASRCMMFDPYVVDSFDPVRVMNPVAKAGFYSHGYGLLPFSISEVPLEEFKVCKIMQGASKP